MDKIKNFLITTKAELFPISIGAVTTGAIISLGSFQMPFQNVAMTILMFVLISAGVQLFNAYYDYKVDKINKPQRPLAKNKIRRDDVLRISLLLKLLAGLVSLSLGKTMFVIYTLAMLLSVCYSYLRWKNNALFNALTCGLGFMALPLMAGYSLSGNLGYETVMLVLPPTIILLGGAILKDIADVRGDKLFGYNSLPILVGIKKTVLISRCIILFGLALFIIMWGLPAVIFSIPIVLMMIYWSVFKPSDRWISLKIGYLASIMSILLLALFAIPWVMMNGMV
jgi:chlorophyll synthase